MMQPFFIAMGGIVSGCFALYIIYSKWQYRLHKPKIKLIFKTIKESSDVFLNQIIPNLYNSFSTVLLGALHGSTANGLLDAGTKFVTVARSLLDVLSRRSEEHTSELQSRGHLVCRLLLEKKTTA